MARIGVYQPHRSTKTSPSAGHRHRHALGFPSLRRNSAPSRKRPQGAAGTAKARPQPAAPPRPERSPGDEDEHGMVRNKNKDRRAGSGRHQPPVQEEKLLRLTTALEEFQASDKRVYKFEPGLSNGERGFIHNTCRKMGMKSKSSGRGNDRCVSVFKCNNNNDKQGPAQGPSRLGFSKEATQVLLDLFTHYPPGDADLNGDAVKKSGDKATRIPWKTDSAFCRPTMDEHDIAKKIEMLTSKKSGHLKKIFEDRSKLPISSFQDHICSTLGNHQVVLISGETGCGKTTQVPQYILDHLWGKGESCKIICTQPRRISAISVAERISAERAEAVGNTVGYKIRLESKGGKNSSIMFCTNGVLLRLLIGRVTNVQKAQNVTHSFDDPVMGITHIIVDEIHERDRFSDFMLAILRDLLPMYPHLHIVLMSATIDADRFSQYFNGCPVIEVPGHTYPVKTFYLEDVLSILQSADDNHLHPASDDLELNTVLTDEYKSSLDEVISMALVNDDFDPLIELISVEQNPEVFNYSHSETGVTPLMVFAGKGQLGDVCMLLSFGVDCSALDHDGKSALDWSQQENQKEVYEVIKKHMDCTPAKSPAENDLLNKYLATISPEHIDTVLIERLLKKICTDSNEGAVLIFLPGWEAINKTRERLLASSIFRDSSKFHVLSLHSMIPSSEQRKVFNRPPAGVRKIILSTNIAETAVTIDDVVFVIDSGRMKEKSYDPYNSVSTLQTSWVSRASARQREGRAGRCQPGTCYHLYSRLRAASMQEYQTPEIKRMPIEELCLQVKLLDPNCRIADFLKKTLDPPVPETVKNAITVLQDLGALTQDEQLTDLGEKLGSLPVHPSTSKMLLFGILMNCLDPALTLACAADYRDPFVLPVDPNQRKRADAAKIELASLYGGFSDQIAVIAAFDCWRRAKDRGEEALFCSRYFVASNTMTMLSSMRKQLQNELAQRGFLPTDASACNLNAKAPGIISAVLLAGAYPMVGRLLPPRKDARGTFLGTASGAKIRLHPCSSNYNLSLNNSSGNPLVIYDEVTLGDDGMSIKKSSVIGSYPLLVLAAEMAVAPDCDEEEGSSVDEEIMSSPDKPVSVVVDRWLRFQATALDVAQIYCLRERLASAILFKVKHPRDVLPPALGATMYAIACILTYDGLPAMVPCNERAFDPRPTERRGFGYIRPNGFLTSLLTDIVIPLNAPQFENSFASEHIRRFYSEHPGGEFEESFASEHIRQSQQSSSKKRKQPPSKKRKQSSLPSRG